MEGAIKNNIQNLICDCKCVERDMDSYLDGTLAPRGRRVFEKHLETCESCAGLVRDVGAIVAVASTLCERPVPEEVSKRLRDRLRSELGVRFSDQKANLTLVK